MLKIRKTPLLSALAATAISLSVAGQVAQAAQPTLSKAPAETIKAASLSKQWDKVFPENLQVKHRKVTFHNRYGITLVGDLYTPKSLKKGEQRPAIALAGPYGAVKEQVSGLYAQDLASRGFIAMAFDPSFTGESAGQPRNTTSPDLNTEDFSAAVDYLLNLPEVAEGQVGIVGICGWGGFALNAAAQDPRIKATVTSTMYDMSRVMANNYFDNGKDPTELRANRLAARKSISAQRTADYKNGTYQMAGGVPTEISDDTPQFVKDYHDFYQTKLGYHPRSFGSTTGGTLSSALSFMNFPLLSYSEEIETPVLMIHGEKAHSRYFSEDAFKKLQGDNKELLIIPGANHTDLYYKTEVIPLERIANFFKENLK
ncbi:MAG: alpha/beta hydrolase [Succinivibrio sp.]|nr:alpha/beta hydrolase [Succinivibrio sp.]